MRTIGTVTLLLLVSIAVGCGGAAPPMEAQMEAVASVRAAREVGAAEQPRAAYHLELAEAQVARADALVDAGRMDDAERMLLRAQADADLAIALTREAAVVAEAEEVRSRIREMRARL